MKRNTREMIIDAARHLFNSKGYSEVSVQEIASAVGISKGNLTYYFNKKEDLLISLISDISPEITDKIPETIEEMDDLLMQLHRETSDHAFYYLHHIPLQNADESVTQKHQEVYRMFNELLINSMKKLKGKGFVRDEMIPGEYANMANTILMACIYWDSFKESHQIKTEFRTYIWNVMYNMLSPKGISRFHQIK